MSKGPGTFRDYMLEEPLSQLKIVTSTTYVAGRIGFCLTAMIKLWCAKHFDL